jgi:hypothetical protein
VLMEVPKIFIGFHTLPQPVFSLFGCFQKTGGRFKLIGPSTKNLIVNLYLAMKFFGFLGRK